MKIFIRAASALLLLVLTVLSFPSCDLEEGLKLYDCETCKDRFKIDCADCGGDKLVACVLCGGDGNKPCKLCSGTGRRKCGVCGGRGYRSFDPTGMSGLIPCASCNGGYIPCDADTPCNCGNGQIECYACDKDGRIPCPDCSAE